MNIRVNKTYNFCEDCKQVKKTKRSKSKDVEKTNRIGKFDKVEITCQEIKDDNRIFVQSLKRKLMKEIDERTPDKKRIEEIRKAITDGTYQCHPAKIAEKILGL